MSIYAKKNLWKSQAIGRIRQTKILNIKLSIEDHTAFKSNCSEKRMSMQDYLYNLVVNDMNINKEVKDNE